MYNYVQCPAPVRAAPSASERSLPHGAVAQRVIDLTESVAGRGVRALFAGPGRAVVGLGTDEICAVRQNHRQNGFSLASRRVLASYSGESPVQSIAILLITRSPTAAVADVQGHLKRIRGAVEVRRVVTKSSRSGCETAPPRCSGSCSATGVSGGTTPRRSGRYANTSRRISRSIVVKHCGPRYGASIVRG